MPKKKVNLKKKKAERYQKKRRKAKKAKAAPSLSSAADPVTAAETSATAIIGDEPEMTEAEGTAIVKDLKDQGVDR
jgi:hypothetical protein